MADAARRPLVGGTITGAFRAEIGASYRRQVASWKPVAETLNLLRFGEQVVTGTVRTIVQRRFPVEELVLQTWYAIRVCSLPALAVSMPFGIILALQVGVLAQEVGAVAFTGAGNTLAVVRQASPLITALMLSGVIYNVIKPGYLAARKDHAKSSR